MTHLFKILNAIVRETHDVESHSLSIKESCLIEKKRESLKEKYMTNENVNEKRKKMLRNIVGITRKAIDRSWRTGGFLSVGSEFGFVCRCGINSLSFGLYAYVCLSCVHFLSVCKT